MPTIQIDVSGEEYDQIRLQAEADNRSIRAYTKNAVLDRVSQTLVRNARIAEGYNRSIVADDNGQRPGRLNMDYSEMAYSIQGVTEKHMTLDSRLSIVEELVRQQGRVMNRIISLLGNPPAESATWSEHADATPNQEDEAE